MGSISQSAADFIVVGAGPAGVMTATRLANSRGHPRVMLVEAGGKNDDKSARIDGEKWLTKLRREQNWGYKTVPQASMDGRILEYDRGKGLGGSSAINFSAWTIAPRDDHDEVARLVGDSEWEWKNAHERYKRIEEFHGSPPDVPEGMERLLNPQAKDHGFSGPIKIGYPAKWEDSLVSDVDHWLASGYKSNPDNNDGDPIGLCIPSSTAFRGIRSTAADALVGAPENLQILTDSQVARVVFEGRRAIGVELLDGTRLHSSRDIILSAGSIDTPRILMHSGIGPSDQLQQFSIPVLDDNPSIGENLQEHPLCFASFPRSVDTSRRREYFRSKVMQADARKQWEKDGTGPLAEVGCQVGMGFYKHDAIFETSEFQELPKEVQTHIKRPTVPIYEATVNNLNFDYLLDPENAPLSAWYACFVMNPMSRGRVFLQSSDPSEPLGLDLNLLSHPYDQRVAIESLRKVIKVADREPTAAIEGVKYLRPSSDSDEDILAFWRAIGGPTWHATGTVKMGKDFDTPGTCVNKNFQVRNVENLRVADMSVVPFVPNNHTQATAYLVGLMAGDKLVAEYHLDE